MESAHDGALEISGAGGGGLADDIVPAEVIADPRPCRKGRQGAALRRGTEKKRVKGYLTRKRLIELHVFEGMRLAECARVMGISSGRAYAVWKLILAEVHGIKDTPEDHRRSVRTYLDQHYRRVIEGSQARLGEAASYGALVVAAGKALAELHGAAGEQIVPAGATLEDVGREVRVVSPLLLDRLEQMRSLGVSAGGGLSGDLPADAPVTLGGVPVEGMKPGAAASLGASSPLLPAGDDKLAGDLERIGKRAVRCAQINGADAALAMIPSAVIGK